MFSQDFWDVNRSTKSDCVFDDDYFAAAEQDPQQREFLGQLKVDLGIMEVNFRVKTM